MNFTLPGIASKEEIRKFISNLKTFNDESQCYNIPKDILVPISSTVNLYSSSPRKEIEDLPILHLKSKKAFLTFFNQSHISLGYEIPLNSIQSKLTFINSGSFGLKICFAIYARSLTLLFQFLLAQDSQHFGPTGKSLIQKGIDMIFSLPINPSFFPQLFQHPFFDFGFFNYQLYTATSICVSETNVFTCSTNGTAFQYIKDKSTDSAKEIFQLPSQFGPFSMVFIDDKLYFINSNKKFVFYNLKTKECSTIQQTEIGYPTISDGYYFYNIQLDNRPRIRFFDKNFNRFRETVKLQFPSSLSITSDMPMSTNGTFLNIIDNQKCHIFSVFTGKFISTQKIESSLQSIVYDSTYNGFLCLSSNGLYEIFTKSTVPPWIINFQPSFMHIDHAISIQDRVFESLAIIAIHYIGGRFDIPLSMQDESCIQSLQTQLSFFLMPDRILNKTAILTLLCILQVKIRRFSHFLSSQLENDFLMIFLIDKFQFARQCAAFLFLSSLHLFEEKWTKNSSKLLRLIVEDQSCTNLVFSFLPHFSFNVQNLDDNLINSILNLMLSANDNRKFKGIVVLSTIQAQLIEKLPETESLLTSYITNLMTRMSESYTAFLSAENPETFSATCFVVVKKLELLIMKNIIRINLPLLVRERLFAVSAMQQMGNDEQNLHSQQLFNRLLYLALYFSFKAIEQTNEFVVFNEKVEKNHEDVSLTDIEIYFDEALNDEQKSILLDLINSSNWVNKASIKDFLNELQITTEDLIEKSKTVSLIQPQPLRKIKNYLLNGQYAEVQYQDSSIFQFMNYAQWIPNSFSKLIFGLFFDKINSLQDDFLCIPRSQLQPFVQNCPVTIMLPLSILQFSEVILHENSIDFYDLKYAYNEISQYITAQQSGEFIQPFMNLTDKSADSISKVHRVLLSAVIGFRKSELKSADPKIISKLVLCRKMVNSLKMARLLLEIVRHFAYKNDQMMFIFILEVIGGAMMKRNDVFPNAKSQVASFQYLFEFIEFARSLFIQSEAFRHFLSSPFVLGSPNNQDPLTQIHKIGFLTIINNLMTYPVVESTIFFLDNESHPNTAKIKKVKKSGLIITLDNDEIYDLRTLKQFRLTSQFNIDSSLFNDEQISRIASFFNNFHNLSKSAYLSKMIDSVPSHSFLFCSKPLSNILYFTSLQCMSFNPQFVEKFTAFESLKTDFFTSSFSTSSGLSNITTNSKNKNFLKPSTRFASSFNVKRGSLPQFSIAQQPEFNEINDTTRMMNLNISQTNRSMLKIITHVQTQDKDITIFPQSISLPAFSSESLIFPLETMKDGDCFMRFWGFYSMPMTDDFTVFELSKGSYATSPISPTMQFSVGFQFPNYCEVSLICFFSLSKYNENSINQAVDYQMVSCFDSFNVVLDPDGQQILMTSHDKTVTFPIFHSAFFYIIYIKTTSLAFKLKHTQITMDKLNSFDDCDFSLFDICRFNRIFTEHCIHFQDAFLNVIGSSVRNFCMRTIVPNILKFKSLDPVICVSYFHVLLSDYTEIFKNGNKLSLRLKGKVDLNSPLFNIKEIIETWLKLLETGVVYKRKTFIWRYNCNARPVKKGMVIRNGVLMSSGSIKYVKERTIVENDGFVLPIDQLDRSAIESLIFAKNFLIFCKEINESSTYTTVCQIMKQYEKDNIPGFAPSDLKSVDMIIHEVEELCGM